MHEEGGLIGHGETGGPPELQHTALAGVLNGFRFYVFRMTELGNVELWL